MSIEQSHGKARPTLPRSSDLAEVPAAPARAASRDESGRFAPGNVVGRGKGWKMACAKLLGASATDPVASAVAADAWKLFSASVREMPSDGATVRGLLAQKARHEALAGFWSAEAVRRGITTPEGIQAQAQATTHGARAERLAVTALDIATKLAAVSRATASALPPSWLRADDKEPR